MNNAQHRIAIPHGFHNDSDSKEVINLVYGLILVDHFFVNGKEVLDSPLDIRFNPAFLNMLPYLLHYGIDPVLSRLSLKMHLIRKIVVNLRLQVL